MFRVNALRHFCRMKRVKNGLNVDCLGDLSLNNLFATCRKNNLKFISCQIK